MKNVKRGAKRARRQFKVKTRGSLGLKSKHLKGDIVVTLRDKIVPKIDGLTLVSCGCACTPANSSSLLVTEKH
jgi:hypothetical protein